MKRNDHRSGDFKIRRAQRQRIPGVFVKSHVNPDDPLVQKGCTKKKKFLTKPRAAAAAARAEKRTGLEHQYYHCRFCGFRHISRVKDKDGKPVVVGARNLVPKVVRLGEDI